ncbi:MAG TPA: 3-methyladenine DNA glycosylase, partial [Gammaproteobacteria bacterium]|nr:3-methyladenine DNA glycosylase [Gammaproteobacteria bacterium]
MNSISAFDSADLLRALRRFDFPELARDPWWWPNSGTPEVVIGAMLTQQTQWGQVEKALDRLREQGLLEFEALARSRATELAALIQGCAFHNTKADRLIQLSRNIVETFDDFERFQREATADWLLRQAGIGPETADSILCYACYQPVMVVDAYSQRLLKSLGQPFSSYRALQQWFERGVANHHKASGLALLYAEYHGRIVCYCKDRGRRGGMIDVGDLAEAFRDSEG